ncbi:MAG: glycoside hydrolase family 140 protein [Mangrovibacterium sp.]
MKYFLSLGVAAMLLSACNCQPKTAATDTCCTKVDETHFLKVSENKRFLETEDGEPFWWMGETAWLLSGKLSKEEAALYLKARKDQGFNVIQISPVHYLGIKDAYGHPALIDGDLSKPLLVDGEEDYWDNLDWMIDEAEENGQYMAIVPVWGNNVRDGHVSREQMAAYGKFIAERYAERDNIIWLNGGDTFGSDSTATWNILGEALHKYAPKHLATYHPRGRMQSNDWFNDQEWLDFNMIQSGHRSWEQDDTERGYGQDNWRYIVEDWDILRPTIDGEPGYEGIPYGLHNPKDPYWEASDVRRYAYWSLFSGAFGYTYGHNATMQFYSKKDDGSAFGCKVYWQEALHSIGSSQMQWVNKLMKSHDFNNRRPAQDMIAGKNGDKYDYITATLGADYAYVYTYTGRTFSLNMGMLPGEKVNARWYDPSTGDYTVLGEVANTGVLQFDSPGVKRDGNDWVLVLETI